MIEKFGITPGPWDTNLEDLNDLCIYDSNGEWIANLDSNIANARLIATAPEMLEALIEIIADCETSQISSAFDKEGRKYFFSICQKYITIIEKATGKKWEDVKAITEVPHD